MLRDIFQELELAVSVANRLEQKSREQAKSSDDPNFWCGKAIAAKMVASELERISQAVETLGMDKALDEAEHRARRLRSLTVVPDRSEPSMVRAMAQGRQDAAAALTDLVSRFR